MQIADLQQHTAIPEQQLEFSRSIVIPNVYEFNRSGMSPNVPVKILDHWREVGSALADAALFWSAYDKMIISPRPIDQSLVDFMRSLGFQKTIIRSPKQQESDLVEDLIADEELLQETIAFGQQSTPVTLLTWGATLGIYRLLQKVASRGLLIQAPDIPARESFWTVLYLDSKAGFRQFCTQFQLVSQDIILPEGFICHSLSNSLEYVRYFFGRQRGCILKANRGVNGVGLIPFELAWSKHSDEKLANYAKTRFHELEFFFSQGPIIVEEMVRSPEPSTAGVTITGSIFINAFIQSNGDVRILGYGCELRDRQNHYIGAEIGKDSQAEAIAPRLEQTLLTIGEIISKYGYRGHLGADFLLDMKGRPVLLELNARRSSESPIYDLAYHLFGSNWPKTHSGLLRLPRYVTLKNNTDVSTVVGVFELVNSKIKRSGVIAIPISLGWLELPSPAIGYVVFGKTRDAITDGERVLLDGLATLGINPRA